MPKAYTAIVVLCVAAVCASCVMDDIMDATVTAASKQAENEARWVRAERDRANANMERLQSASEKNAMSSDGEGDSHAQLPQ
jgi:hypothetical protein